MTRSQFIQLLKKQSRLGLPKKKKPILPSTEDSNTTALSDFFEGVQDIVPTVGQVKNVLDDFIQTQATLIKSFEKGNDAIGNQVAGLDVLLGRNQAIGKSYMEFAKRSLSLEKRYESLNKNFRISAVEAFKLGKQFDNQAASLKISGKQALQYGSAIKKMLPTIRTMKDEAGRASQIDSDFFKSLTMTQKVITTNMGLSEQAAERFTYFSTNQKQSAAEVLLQTQASAKAIEDATGMQGAFSIITEEIGNTSEDVLLQFGRMPGKLELAVMKGKALGLSLTEVTKIGTKMLDIESSIGNELEYQLLSGQRLTNNAGESLTNKFREAALSGDANQQAETLNELLETQGDVLNDNVLARQKMADLLGMDEASLSRALMKRKLLEKEGAEVLMNLSGDDFEEAAQQMLESGQLSEETFKELKGLGDQRTTEQRLMEEQLDVQLDQLALQQIQLITSKDFTDNQKTIEKGLKSQIQNVQKLDADDTLALGKTIRAYDAAMATSGISSNFAASYDQAIQKTEDLLYIPGQETSTGKYGDLFKLDKRDAVAAGPPGAIAAAANGGSSTLHIDYNKLATAMSNVKLEVTIDPKASKFAS